MLRHLGIGLLFIALTYAYLYPGSEALFSGNTKIVLSDDTDPAPLPFIYEQYVQVFKNHPSRLLYGSVFLDVADPEKGFASWAPWSERIIPVVGAALFPYEQLSTFVVFVIFMFNALAMYALCRYLGFQRALAVGLGIAWAFSAYTRARAKVHMAMAGTYHLPLIFLAMLLVVRERSRKSLWIAAGLFLLSVSVIHYYIVTALFLAPFFLLFVALQPESRGQARIVMSRLAVAVLPAILLLGFNFAFKIPGDVKMKAADAVPQSGATPNGERHPFLTIFDAKPIDYLGGDISFHGKPDDLNPLREIANESILSSLAGSFGNTHERTNGIRYSVLLLALAAFGFAIFNRKEFIGDSRRQIFYFLGFGAFGLWLSLSPDFPFDGIGPSGWLYSLMPQIRVPSRAGIYFYFSCLMAVGFLVKAFANTPKRQTLVAFIFPALMIVDYPPLMQPMPMATVRPAIHALSRENGACGTGMYFPFVSNLAASNVYYGFLQRMRGTDCTFVNALTRPETFQKTFYKFPPSDQYLQTLLANATVIPDLKKMADCVPLSFIVFDPAVNPAFRQQACAALGWTLTEDIACVAPNKSKPMQRFPDECAL